MPPSGFFFTSVHADPSSPPPAQRKEATPNNSSDTHAAQVPNTRARDPPRKNTPPHQAEILPAPFAAHFGSLGARNLLTHTPTGAHARLATVITAVAGQPFAAPEGTEMVGKGAPEVARHHLR